MNGENEEVVNPRTFGKALAHRLSEKFQARGYRVPAYSPEDFGWWIEIVAYNFENYPDDRINPNAKKIPGSG